MQPIALVVVVPEKSRPHFQKVVVSGRSRILLRSQREEDLELVKKLRKNQAFRWLCRDWPLGW